MIHLFSHINSEQIERDKGVWQVERKISSKVTERAGREYDLDMWQHLDSQCHMLKLERLIPPFRILSSGFHHIYIT